MSINKKRGSIALARELCDELMKPLYTTPPQRKWVGLTDGDWEWVADKKETSLDTFAHGAAWAADQLKEKNK